MKKYLLAFIPFLLCTLLALIYCLTQPQDYPHPSYPSRTPGVLYYLSTRWFIIGIVLSGLFLLLLAIEDVFKYFENWCGRRRFRQ